MKLIALELSLVCDWKGLCCEVKSENIFFFRRLFIYLIFFFEVRVFDFISSGATAVE